jgi:hypothetical protein
MVMPTVPRVSPSIQDSVGGDYFRTPVKIQVADIYLFVGAVWNRVNVEVSSGLNKFQACTAFS